MYLFYFSQLYGCTVQYSITQHDYNTVASALVEAEYNSTIPTLIAITTQLIKLHEKGKEINNRNAC
jgi:transketolase